MQRRELFKWTTPVILSISLPAHAETSPSIFLAEMDVCDINEGRIFSGITLSNLGTQEIYVATITSNIPNVLSVPSLPISLQKNENVYLHIEGNITDTNFRCGDTVELAIVGSQNGSQFSTTLFVS